ncbi:Acyl-protein thioesterase 1 [Morella rubra]|uniref:Acyl-protein thioesterase 1 n=1 Tax=Morella rubra TaxID=262757 RepID=A0A6A1VLL3_9ROSI|nr:Acyl-protein thioesterase 1 [Morella rubra]KAB1221750.1 Acyl-protein thioesterase 1 [Morella rubra]
MKLRLLAKPVAVIGITLTSTILFILFSAPNQSSKADSMARSFVLWLHGLGDSGPANEPIKTLFTSPEFRNTVWSFPSAPFNPVTCNHGAVMPSWFDIIEIPVTAITPRSSSKICVVIADYGALTLASVLLYPKTLGGGAVFSGWLPFNSSIIEQISPNAKRTPILWSHGMDDRTVLFEAGQAGPPFLEQVGVSSEFKAYPGLGHSITSEELKYLESWIKTHPGSCVALLIGATMKAVCRGLHVVAKVLKYEYIS